MSSKWISRPMLVLSTLLCTAAGSASVSFRSPVNYTVGTNPTAIAVGDFNGDGKPDLAVVNAGDASVNDPGGISILLGNGDGTFESALNFSDGNSPTQIAVGDFNGDGNDDLVVVRPGVQGGSDKGDVSIFLSNGDGTFGKAQLISTFSNPLRVVATDLDSDGAMDLAVADSNSTTILLGKGDGTFRAGGTYPTIADQFGSTVARQLVILDFNHDGKKDLGITVLHSLEVLLGNGDGTFQSASIIRTFSFTETPSFSADFNHDGNVDVIVAACNPFNPPCGESLLLSNGDGTFSDPPGSNVLMPGATTVGNFDGDGNTDIAGTSSSGTPGLAIFAGNGDGSFQQPVTFSNPSINVVAVAADLNVDGAPDIVTLDSGNTISVILNVGTDFSLSASVLTPTSIGAGQSASSTLSLQLLNLFNNPVALSCSVQPAQTGAPTCSLNANSVTFDSSGKASATLTISDGSFAFFHNRMNPSVPTWFPIAGLALIGAGFSSRVRNKRMLLRIVPFAALFGLIFLQACGGSAGPKSTNYAITITGTSGRTSHSTIVNVTVQ